MRTIQQLTGTEDLKTNLVAFALLSFVIVLITAFIVLTAVNGIKSF